MFYYPDLKTPKWLCQEYSQVELLGWSPSKIGIFLTSNLLVGVLKTNKTSCMIREKSFLKLMSYACLINSRYNELLNLNKKEALNLMSPMELFQEYPRVELIGWNAAKIGMFLNSRLLVGIQKDSKQASLITEKSFQRLVGYVNDNLDWKKVFC